MAKYRIKKEIDKMGTFFYPQLRVLGIFWISFPFDITCHATLDRAVETVKKSVNTKKRSVTYFNLSDNLDVIDTKQPE